MVAGEKNNDYDGEIAMYMKALELVPNHFHAQYSLACALGGAKRWDESISAFRRAIDIVDTKERKDKVLQDLYRVAIMKVNADPTSRPKSNDEMLNLFLSIMGKENYNDLLKSMSKR